MTAVQIKNSIKEEVFKKPEFAFAKKPERTLDTNWPGLFLMGLIMLILLPVIILWILMLHLFYERKDKNCYDKRSVLNDDLVRRLEEDEDLFNQNQFTQVLVMKPGKVRLITVHALMLFARTLIKNLFVKGKLMGIPTIHFARWVLIDKNKHMMFFSNFDGSWNQYLCDFIDKSGWGLTGIFSNTVNFPKTKYLFTGGAYDEEHFLAWSRGTLRSPRSGCRRPFAGWTLGRPRPVAAAPGHGRARRHGRSTSPRNPLPAREFSGRCRR